MRAPQFARRSLSAAVCALALVACGKESGPSQFNPEGATADVAAAQAAFVSTPSTSFAALGADISTVLGGSPVASAAPLTLMHPSAGTARYAEQLVRLLPGGGSRIQATVTAIPSAVAGATFVWDTATDAYVASDLPGAPSSGVRFVLYAIDPITLRPVEPVTEVGYVDLIDQSTASNVSFRLKVVDGNIVYLDYSVGATASSGGGTVTVSGYASNGTDRANFTLRNAVSQSATGLVLSLNYDLSVPSRNVTLDWTATFANISATEVVVTLDLAISGSNGDVRLVGTYGATGGTFTVTVNGDAFATVTLDGSTPVITGAGGQPLTPAEEETLNAILDYYDQSLAAFTALLAPLS